MPRSNAPATDAALLVALAAANPESSPRHATKSINRREFFRIVVSRLKMDLPADLATFRHRANSMLLKIDFGNERVHYEVWPDSARGHIEVGLHFEDGPMSTAAYLAFFDARIVEIKHTLGPQIELERWTASWGHLFESTPLAPLDRRLAESIADRLTAQIALLQPLVLEAAVPAERSADPVPHRGRWRRRAAG